MRTKCSSFLSVALTLAILASSAIASAQGKGVRIEKLKVALINNDDAATPCPKASELSAFGRSGRPLEVVQVEDVSDTAIALAIMQAPDINAGFIVQDAARAAYLIGKGLVRDSDECMAMMASQPLAEYETDRATGDYYQKDAPPLTRSSRLTRGSRNCTAFLGEIDQRYQVWRSELHRLGINSQLREGIRRSVKALRTSSERKVLLVVGPVLADAKTIVDSEIAGYVSRNAVTLVALLMHPFKMNGQVDVERARISQYGASPFISLVLGHEKRAMEAGENRLRLIASETGGRVMFTDSSGVLDQAKHLLNGLRHHCMVSVKVSDAKTERKDIRVDAPTGWRAFRLN